MPHEAHPLSRRDLINLAGQSAIAAGVAGAFPQWAGAQPPAGGGAAPHVELPPLSAPTEQKQAGTPNPMPPDGRVGYAIVGLGRIALEEMMPGIVQSKR
jgi:hypothetical protein